MTPGEKTRFFKTARSRIELRAGRTDWFEIKDVVTDEHTGTSSAEIRIYDEIGWFGVTAEEFASQLAAIDADEITLRIDSPGGSAFDGITIFNRAKEHRATIHVIVDGMAASAASVIAMAGDRVTMKPEAMMMIHDASGLVIGQAQDMVDMAELLAKVSANLAALYARETGVGTAEAWRAMMTPSDTWFTAEEAVEAGLAHDIDGAGSNGDSDADNSWDLSIYSYAGRGEAPAPDLEALIASLDPADPPADPDPPEVGTLAGFMGGWTATPETNSSTDNNPFAGLTN